MTLSKWDAIEANQSGGEGSESDNTPVYHQPDILQKTEENNHKKFGMQFSFIVNNDKIIQTRIT